jgi:hypothetical protein
VVDPILLFGSGLNDDKLGLESESGLESEICMSIIVVIFHKTKGKLTGTTNPVIIDGVIGNLLTPNIVDEILILCQ